MNQQFSKIFVAGIAALAITGCASIVSGTTDTIAVKSSPDGAIATITNRAGEKIHTGTTPATITLQRGAGFFKPEVYRIKFEKSGYADKEIEVRADVNGWYFGNIVFGGLIGLLIVDPATGAMYRLDGEKFNATLDAAGSQQSQNGNSLTIISAKDVPADVMKNAQRIDSVKP